MTPDLLPARMQRRITADGDCWLWDRVAWNGYGVSVYWRGKRHPAHRSVYLAVHGAIPDGFDLDHLCRNRRCVRPDHLEPVTRAENLSRSGQVGKWNARKTHCPQGHEFTSENTYADSRGWRGCVTCRKDASRRAAKRRSAA